MGKDTLRPYEAAVNRNLSSNGVSTASAVPMGQMDHDYPDEDLPTYEATSSSAPLLSNHPHDLPSGDNQPVRGQSWYIPPPDLPFAAHDFHSYDFWTRFPNYSTDAHTLRQMILEQAQYAPSYYVEISGTHKESQRDRKNDSTITDFDIKLNLTHLLTNGIRTGGRLELLPNNQKGYRGGRMKSYEPSISSGDMESSGDELYAWCEKFVSDPAKVKCFIFERHIINHDKKKLEDLLHALVRSTNYRGRVGVNFTTQHRKVIVYSPSRINEWRMTPSIRAIFYLTFLWLFSWPLLVFLTHRYEVVKAFYQYADKSNSDERGRRATVQSELEFYNHWQAALRTAIVGRLVRKECLDDEYRISVLQAEIARGQQAAQILHGGANTGSAFGDGVVGILGAGTALVREYNDGRGWGYDETTL